MNRALRSALLILLLMAGFMPARAEPDVKMLRKASDDFLKAVMSDILQNPETAKYFPGLKMSDVNLGLFDDASYPAGWVGGWNHEHDVHYVSGQTQSGRCRVFENNRAIVFKLSFTSGDRRKVEWNERYLVSKESNFVVSLAVETGDGNAPLSKIAEIVKAHLGALQKVVNAP